MTHPQSNFKWLLRRIRRRIPALLLLSLCSIGSSLCGVFFALGTKGVIDAAVSGEKSAFFSACIIQASIIMCLLICHTLSRHLTEHIHASLDMDWKKSILHDLLESEYRSVSKYHSSELLNRLNNDVRILDDNITNLLPNLCSMVTKLVAAFCVLASLAPWFTLAVLCAGIAVISVTGIVRKHLKALHKRFSESNGRVSGILQETMEKLLAVQAMGVSNEIERRTKLRLDERFAIHRKRKNVSLLANTFVVIMYYGAGFATLVFCASGLLTGTMSFGTMSAITQLINQLQQPLVGLSGIIPQYIAATAALERIQEITMLPKTFEPCAESAADIYARTECIVGSDLTFTYDRDRILNETGFSLEKGTFSVITGPSGVGKSTVLKLLLGIFVPEQGSLYLQCGDERIPINGSTRKLFSYVPQGNLLFSGTIKDNLLVVKPDATEEEISQAVYVSAMDLYLQQLPNGLDTELGESGAGLSEGQAQRLAIARAILGGAPILLLDECTSALDTQTEALVLQRLRQLDNKTCIAVTHRLVAESICDISIQMHEGKIHVKHNNHATEVENGT